MIRQATRGDAPQAAPLFILAMGHIAGVLAGSERHQDAIPFFEDFFRRTDNQYSFLNTLVFEEEKKILGFVVGYDGAQLHALRQPVIVEVRKKQPDFSPDDETGPGEFYLDCISVAEGFQSRGIGKKLIVAFCERAVSLGYDRVGLIVDLENPKAGEFYEKLGFEVAGEKQFLGHRYFHMIKSVNKS